LESVAGKNLILKFLYLENGEITILW
jgi:hypothetical protein